MDTEIQIRKATINDLSELSQLCTRTFYQAYEWYNTPENMRNYVEKYFSVTQLDSELKDVSSLFLVVEMDQKLIGYAKIGTKNKLKELEGKPQVEIERIYIDEELQRTGFGKKLFDEIVNEAKKLNAEFIWLGVWQRNMKAVNFYMKNGFKIIGLTQFVLGDDVQDDYVMTKKIDY